MNKEHSEVVDSNNDRRTKMNFVDSPQNRELQIWRVSCLNSGSVNIFTSLVLLIDVSSRI